MRLGSVRCMAPALVTLIGCSDDGGGAVRGRTDGVPGSASPPSAALATSATATATASAPARPGKLCDRAPPKPGAKLPDVKLSSLEAPGETALGDAIQTGGGKWTFVNVWAGWCKPCIEEIPLLKSWERKLGDKLRIAFVSVDDDERLTLRVLGAQPAEGVRRTHWLKDTDGRASWFEGLGAAPSSLPVQILLDPQGSVRCVVNGPVYANDFAEVQALVSG